MHTGRLKQGFPSQGEDLGDGDSVSVSSPVVFADHFDCKDHIPSARGMGLWGLNTFWAGDLREWGVVTGERLAIDIPSSSTFFSVLLRVLPFSFPISLRHWIFLPLSTFFFSHIL